MKIGPKLIGSFAIVALICGIVGGVGWYGIGQLDESMDEIGGVRLPSIQALMTMDAVLGDAATAQMELLNPSMDLEEVEGLYAEINEAFATVDAAGDDFRGYIADAEDERIFNEVIIALDGFKQTNDQLVAMSRQLDTFGSRNPLGMLFDITELEAFHRDWHFQLSEAVIDRAEFAGELSVAACPMGVWIDEFDLDNKKLKTALGPLSKAHQDIHAAATSIVDIFGKSTNDIAAAAAMTIFDEQATPALFGMVDQIDNVFNGEGERGADLFTQMTEHDHTVLEPAFELVMTGLDELNADVTSDAAASRQAGDEAASLANTLIITSITLGIIISLGFGVVISRGISRPIGKIAEISDQIAMGDIQHEIDIRSKDEIGILAGSFRKLITYMNELSGAAESIAKNDLTISVEPKSEKDVLGNSFKTMITNLTGMVRQLTSNAGELVSAATEISSASEQMSRGANDQSQQVEQVSSAIEEMTATIVESSNNAGEETDASKGASDTATSGGQIVSDTIQGMQKIADVVKESAESIAKLATSADQIGEIIGVIDDIADQTNLLALNAAIEAARAGEQGRGFAVVADEVRKLAERTGKATGEITEMIKGIQTETEEAVHSMETGIQEVDKGRTLADQAGNSLGEIVTMSGKVMDMIQQIATASEEQSSAAEQISKNVEQVASITKETATGAEQSATAAEELNRQAEGLKDMVGQFKVVHRENVTQ